ncbi:MAG: hypothetical protein KDE48_25285 [Anaerolineales bacterium]|nr:hypothetical protein [Anaerolineales bacterium]
MRRLILYELRLNLWATLDKLLPGYRIRLEVYNNNFPCFNRNRTTGRDSPHP